MEKEKLVNEFEETLWTWLNKLSKNAMLDYDNLLPIQEQIVAEMFGFTNG